MPEFIGGAELSGLFYEEVVRPFLEREFPGLSYAAALIGYGSEVLGYDTPISTDHNWGPRLLLFPREEGDAGQRAQIVAALRDALPRAFRGYPIGYGPPDAEGVRRPATETAEPVEHMVEVHALRDFLASWLGVDATGELTLADWLCLPAQKLLEVTAGRVFHDGPGELTWVRSRLAYYPHDLWLYLLAAQWTRIAQQEAFVGRAGDVGDDLGSALIAGTLVRDLMNLCFLMERPLTV